MKLTIYEKQRRAFDEIYDRFPFFASFAMTWKIAWTDKVPYAATNGPDLFLNPKFVEQLNIGPMVDLILHELCHVFLGHMHRFPELVGKGARKVSKGEHREFNVAADAAANDYIRPYLHMDEKNVVRDIMIFPGELHQEAGDKFRSWPKNKDAEFYLGLIRKSRKEEPKMPSMPGQPKPEKGDEGDPDDGDQTGEGSGSGGDKESEGDTKQAGSAGTGEVSSENQKILDSVYGEAAEGEFDRNDLPESLGDVLPHPVYSEEVDEESPEAKAEHEKKVEQAEQQWKKQVAQGINNAKMHGNLPGWLEELAKGIYGTKSNQNWKGLLRRFMTRIVSSGFESFERPNRRNAWRQDLIIPTKRSRQASKGAILVDTSGSMSAEQMNAALQEMEGILSTFPRCEVTMMMADTRLIDRYKKVYKHYDFPIRVPVEWLGRGGTDINGPIQEVIKDHTYKWLVVISDMEWYANQMENPKVPTIFVWTPRQPNQTKPYSMPKYGTLIGPVYTK